MTDPERLESGLGDLLRRTNWQGPAPTDPEPLDAEERARWQSLMDEPAQDVQPATRRVPIGLVGATGLVAAVLVVAVGISSVRNLQQPRPVAESIAPPAPGTPARSPSRTEPLPELAPKNARKAAPPTAPGKVASPLPASPPTKPATPNRTTIVASAPEESDAPAVQPSTSASVPDAPQRAKASRPVQPVPAAINDDGQANSTSVPDGDRTSTDILNGVSTTATRRLNRAADSMLPDAATNQARSERQQAAKSSPPPPNRLAHEMDRAVSPTRLELVASGLEAIAAASLRTQLAMVTLPAGLNGEVVFEVVVEAGRVRDLRLIEEDSTLKDPTVIDAIRSRLLAWTLPTATNLKSRIALRAQP